MLSSIRCVVFGSGRCGDGANATELPESEWTDWLRNGSHLCEPFILILNSDCASVPEVGALCGSSARRDLCGGRRVTGVPTATSSPLFHQLDMCFGTPNKGRFTVLTAEYFADAENV